MKITKMLWIYLGTGILALVLVILALTRFQQAAEQKRLGDELALVQTRLAGLELGQLTVHKVQLQEQVSQANAELQTSINSLNQATTSIASDERLFALAQECQVVIVDISASESHSAKLNGIPCTTFPIEVKVEGTTEALTDFVIRLKSYFKNSTVESVDIRVSVTPEETTIPEETAPASATIRISVYNYEGV